MPFFDLFWRKQPPTIVTSHNGTKYINKELNLLRFERKIIHEAYGLYLGGSRKGWSGPESARREIQNKIALLESRILELQQHILRGTIASSQFFLFKSLSESSLLELDQILKHAEEFHQKNYPKKNSNFIKNLRHLLTYVRELIAHDTYSEHVLAKIKGFSNYQTIEPQQHI